MCCVKQCWQCWNSRHAIQGCDTLSVNKMKTQCAPFPLPCCKLPCMLSRCVLVPVHACLLLFALLHDVCCGPTGESRHDASSCGGGGVGGSSWLGVSPWWLLHCSLLARPGWLVWLGTHSNTSPQICPSKGEEPRAQHGLRIVGAAT